MINATDAFSYACSGALSERQVDDYAQYVHADAERVRKLGGWLSGRVDASLAKFQNFVDSRVWELSKRLSGDAEGEYVGRFEIGYLGTVEGFQNAQGFMRDYSMANPMVMSAYESGMLEGYGGEFSSFCTGIGDDNLFYRKAMHGVVHFETEEDKTYAHTKHYYDSVGGHGLSQRERLLLQHTWRAAEHHMAKELFDITSPTHRAWGPVETDTPEEE